MTLPDDFSHSATQQGTGYGYGTGTGGGGWTPTRTLHVSRYNQRMAQRVARRAKVNESGVTVAFTFNNLFTAVVLGTVEDIVRYIPSIGGALELICSVFGFYFHRIVLVTDRSVYIYRDLPFHIPGRRLAAYDRGPGLVRIGSDRRGWFSRIIRRGQLNFSDGTVVYHGILWIRRAQYIVQEGNIGLGR